MREIKFRAWDIKGRRWVTNNFGIDCHGMRYWIFGYSADPVDRSEYQLMQFTGLRDKNKKEIYEGDFVEVDFSKNGPYQIRWNEKLIRYDGVNKQGMSWDLYLGRNCVLSVIGNIYENTELFK